MYAGELRQAAVVLQLQLRDSITVVPPRLFPSGTTAFNLAYAIEKMWNIMIFDCDIISRANPYGVSLDGHAEDPLLEGEYVCIPKPGVAARIAGNNLHDPEVALQRGGGGFSCLHMPYVPKLKD